MGEVIPFPTTSKKPACPACGKALPSFAGMNIMLPMCGLGDFKLVGAKITLRCPCGAEFDAGSQK